MTFPPEIMTFVQAAVRLPHSRLRTIDLGWQVLHVHRRVVDDLVQGNTDLWAEMEHLQDYVMVAARQAEAAGETPGPLIPEEVAEIVLPAARAVLLRDALEFSADESRAQAFAALTALFKDILPRTRQDGERRGDR